MKILFYKAATFNYHF